MNIINKIKEITLKTQINTIIGVFILEIMIIITMINMIKVIIVIQGRDRTAPNIIKMHSRITLNIKKKNKNLNVKYFEYFSDSYFYQLLTHGYLYGYVIC